MTDEHIAVTPTIYAGIDTHKHTHHAALVDELGRPLDDRQFPTTATGHQQLLAWLTNAGTVARVGVEGTGSYGSNLTTALHAADLDVVEVDHPDRRARRSHGKTDTIDAYAAATAALTGRATTVPKTHDGPVESIRLLYNARRTVVKARAEAITGLKAMLVTAPEPLRSILEPLPDAELFATCARLEPDRGSFVAVAVAAQAALQTLARLIQDLTKQEKVLTHRIRELVEQSAPVLVEQSGIGTVVAAQLLITIGDNPGRIRSEAAFAHHCGCAPVQASSGKVRRHRLNRGGDRQANSALYIIVITRMRFDERTRAYVARRTAENKSKREIIRCLKRAVAREIYQLYIKPAAVAAAA